MFHYSPRILSRKSHSGQDHICHVYTAVTVQFKIGGVGSHRKACPIFGSGNRDKFAFIPLLCESWVF